jgi:hypothetical protein
VSTGPSTATQTATNTADADAKNKSKTDQDATATQTAGSSSCYSGCGGNGQEQNVIQDAKTKQHADSDAKAKQDAINANVPVLTVGGDPTVGPSSATQTLTNEADSDATNRSKTNQDANVTQTGDESSCWSGCGGNGQEQNVIQDAKTKQHADSDAKAKQDAINLNLPVAILGTGPPGSGSNTATQTATNKANSDASNKSRTHQDADVLQQLADAMCGGGCGGKGQEQNLIQHSKTKQHGDSFGKAKQNLANTNAPFLLSLGKGYRDKTRAV